jgi:DNA-binding IclR family transcriptional regulator
MTGVIVKSLGTALKLLRFFATDRHEWRVTDLALISGLHKSQVSRILQTFETYGFIRKRDGQYELGQAFKTYASLAKTGNGLAELARPVMERISKQTQATVMLKIREGAETITIDRVESQHFLRLAYPVDLRLPLNVSASGKVFLAHMPVEERTQLYRSGFFQKFTGRTKTKSATLEQDLSAVLRKGFAVSDEEHLLGIRGVAAPIFGRRGNLEATLGLGLPKVLLPDRMIEETASMVRIAAAEISLLLGYRLGSSIEDAEDRAARSGSRALQKAGISGDDRNAVNQLFDGESVKPRQQQIESETEHRRRENGASDPVTQTDR